MSYESRWTGPLSIRHDAVMGIQVLTLDGALESRTASAASRALDDALDRSGPLVLDLGRTRAIDAAGEELLRASLGRLREGCPALTVVRPRAVEPARLVRELCAEAKVTVVESLSAGIEKVSPAWKPGSRRWSPERAVQITSRRDPPRAR